MIMRMKILKALTGKEVEICDFFLLLQWKFLVVVEGKIQLSFDTLFYYWRLYGGISGYGMAGYLP
jgi:hypothetical protein